MGLSARQPCSDHRIALVDDFADDEWPPRVEDQDQAIAVLSCAPDERNLLSQHAIEKLGADGELGDTDALAVVRKEIKKLQDSVDGAEKAGRPEAVDAAKAEIAVLEKYLPAAMSADELAKLVETVIAELGATSKKDMGGVMKALQERVAGRADSKSISTEVAKRLA